MSKSPYLTIGSVARHFGCPAWKVRRLFERGLLPPALRVGPYRVIAREDLARIETALRQTGYLARSDHAKGPTHVR
jgi:DNA-binding transcriptional MerR regulator